MLQPANDFYRSVAIEHVGSAPVRADRPRQAILSPTVPGRPTQWSPSLMTELPLTLRERDVLRWLGAGKTDKDIGAILAISPRTVQKHLQRIYEKLGVETRTAAVRRALGD